MENIIEKQLNRYYNKNCKKFTVLLFIENRRLANMIYIRYLKETKDRGDKKWKKKQLF